MKSLKFMFFGLFTLILTCFEVSGTSSKLHKKIQYKKILSKIESNNHKGFFYAAADILDFEEITESNYPDMCAWYKKMQEKYPEVRSKTWDCFAIDKNKKSTQWRDAIQEINGGDLKDYVICPHSMFEKEPSLHDEFELLCCLGIKSVKKFEGIVVTADSSYPEAYAWYQSMHAKYPEAELDKITFVVAPRDGWAMSHAELEGSWQTIVICPLQTIKKGFTAGDEWALLHEAGHAKNHKDWSRFYKRAKPTMLTTAGFTGVALLASGLQGYEMIKKLPYVKESKVALAGISIAAVCALYFSMKKVAGQCILRIDERYADKFALQQGDQRAQIGGIEDFESYIKSQNEALGELKKALGNTRIGNACINMNVKCFKMFFYPHPMTESRIDAIKQTLKKRFNHSVATA